MELTPKQQTIELIKNAQKILIVTHKNPDGDAIGSILSLSQGLQQIGKQVTAICSGDINSSLKFLPKIDQIKPTLDVGRDLTVSIDTSHAPNSEFKLGYKNDRENNKLNIVIMPTNGIITKENVTFKTNLPTFDLIIALDIADIERIGNFYDEFTSLFYETPLVNIDHHPGNDHFGKVNWIDLTATSTCEILVSLLESLSAQNNNLKLLDEDVATALLTGIITDTDSFQNANTTPKSFTVAAQLVGAGARQQEIIRSIYKTKPLSTLHLWGKVLTNVTEEINPHFVWSYVAKSDFTDLNATPTQLTGVIDELLKSAPGVDFALLFSERPAQASNGLVLHGSLRAVAPATDVASMAANFGGGGHTKAAAFEQPRSGNLNEQIVNIIQSIKSSYSAPTTLEMPQEELVLG